MTTRYFSHAPRGFVNEVNVYAVPSELAERWLDTFEARLGSKADYAETAVVPITRRQAERLIRRDGVGLVIRPSDYDHHTCREDRLLPLSVASARLVATAMLGRDETRAYLED